MLPVLPHSCPPEVYEGGEGRDLFLNGYRARLGLGDVLTDFG